MKMHDKHITNFPRFAKLISTHLPLMVHNNNIISSIEQAAGKGSADMIRKALLWGQPPWVYPADIDDNGIYTAPTNTLKINFYRILEYQYGNDIETTKNGKSVRVKHLRKSNVIF